ncbi:anti-sigma-D factor RsdA [Mycolicibacterium litorale]|uniref:anti-sigma-D factor RsdA n=1 Tax=Mycolicibacterium litorale TaxID=758802 RepID=UPI003CF5BA7F
MPDFPRRSLNGGDPSLPELNHTDRLLDALAMEQPVYSNEAGESELAYLLAGWRDEVRQAPMSTVVTPRDAAIALDRATSTTKRRRFSLAVVGSVAAAVLCLGGFGSVVYGAGPGDPLYGVRTMLFGEQQATRDDQVALAAQTQMAQVEQLIEQGDWTAAQNKLQTLTTTVAAVGDTSRQQELVDQWQQLSVKVETRDANATVPPDAPPVVLPAVPSDLPLPVLLSPDATSPSSTSPTDTTSPTAPSSTAPTSTDPSVTTTESPATTPPPATTVTSAPASTSSPPPPSATPSTAPTQAPSSSAAAEPGVTTTGAPVEAPPPSSAPASTTEPAVTTTAPPVTTTTVAPTTAVAPPAAPTGADDAEVEVEEPRNNKPAPKVEKRPEAAVAVPTTTVMLPLPLLGSGSGEE